MKIIIEITKKEKRISYIILCSVLLLGNVICGIIIGVDVTELHSFNYHAILAWTAISTILYYWIMFKRKNN